MRTGRLLSLGAIATFGALAGFAALSPLPGGAQSAEMDSATFFESKIRPLLIANCTGCHGEQKQMRGLRLDSRAAMLMGGESGTALVPGTPDKSALIRAVLYDGNLKMPPTGKLAPDEIAALTAWVKMGAPWPDAKPGASPAPTDAPYVIPAEKRNFWSFRPVRRPSLPQVKNAAWIKSPIDRFILAKLEAKGLTPAPQADKRTLIRRATFDLTGLPPTPQEIDAFLADKSPNAFAKVVDHLLASPRYGERWGRHWLDVVRYCDSLDSRGIGSEGDISEAWRYRDWVVNALNADMPYNTFVINQIAGDLLPAKRPGDLNVPGTIATGLLAIGNWGNGDADKEKLLTDIADDQVDVVSRGFMGLTVACARCHDHKFDPIPTTDYYGMAGIFFSTHILPKLTPKGAGETPLRIPLISKAEQEQRDRYAAQVADVEKRLQTTTAATYTDFARSLLPQTDRYLTAAWEVHTRPQNQAGVTLTQFANERGLHAYALRQWTDFLGMSDYRPLTQFVPALLGNTGVSVWKGEADTPSVTINTNDFPRPILTFTLPPKSVSVHPSPANGVVVGWRSPLTGTVRIGGRVVDADPAGGDGIAWILDRRTPAGIHELASGDIPNGGAQEFAQGTGAANLSAVNVRQGDQIQLLVLPKKDYTCDTTTVTFTISDGSRTWDLTRDIAVAPHSGNKPELHGDPFGNADVWRFEDMADSRRANRPAGALGAALTQWEQTVAAVADGSQGREAIEKAALAFQAAFTQTDKNSPFWITNRADETALPDANRILLANLNDTLDALKKQAPPPIQYANGAQEGGCPESPQAGFHDVRVHIRGSYARLGALVPRHFPIVLAGENQKPITSGSGRLELARWLTRESHPLTTRVIVNRVWQHHFGEGIVRTPSNFGFLGERPTHPELLDWLASEFIKSGWSLKKLHHAIMLSATYQQASFASARSRALDPDNRLFGRMNRLRLEAEAVRDNLLSVAGRLDTTTGGPSIRDFSVPRRTLYITTIRSDRSGFGPLFDAADSTASADHRAVSTVAPQALFLLNNPFVMEQTKALAKRLLSERLHDDTARIRRAYLLLYGRPAAPEEIKIGLAFLARARTASGVHTAALAPSNAELTAWTAYCQILLCANEFIYVD